MGYIDRYSWKCLLGKMSRNVIEQNHLYRWEVNGRKNFCTDRDLAEEDIPLIAGSNFSLSF